MKRDGANTSLWQATASGMNATSFENGVEVFDLIIAGGGITGITAAYLMQKAGHKVLLLEARELCFGTTSGTTAHLNTFFDTPYHTMQKNFGDEAPQLIANAARNALALYDSIISEENIDCEYSQSDALLYARDKQQLDLLNKIYESCVKAGVPVEMLSSAPINDDVLGALKFPGQASVHPARYAIALARRFQEMGGIIHQHSRVEEVVEMEGGVAVDAASGAFKTKYFLWATHIPSGINMLHTECSAWRSYAIAFEATEGSITDFIYDLDDPYYYYRPQTIDGKSFIIAGGEDHKTGHESDTESRFDSLEARARAVMPLGTRMFKWSSQYYEPADGLPYIGVIPGSKGRELVATGFGGNGMIYSHVAAGMITDLLNIQQSPLEKLLDPSRVKPLAAIGQVAKDAADMVAHFVGDRFKSSKIRELEEMKNGEGRIVKYDGQKLALYKDDQGGIHALKPVCTHMKCIVGWNASEKSWDCPCHGARFDVDGEVLNAPSSKDLQRVELDGEE